jgi:hypothetical protein
MPHLHAMLCYATLCYAMLCYAMLCCAMLRYAMLAMLCYARAHRALLTHDSSRHVEHRPALEAHVGLQLALHRVKRVRHAPVGLRQARSPRSREAHKRARGTRADEEPAGGRRAEHGAWGRVARGAAPAIAPAAALHCRGTSALRSKPYCCADGWAVMCRNGWQGRYLTTPGEVSRGRLGWVRARVCAR